MKTMILCAAAIAVATPASAESWMTYSRSQTTAYLADIDSITVTGDITSMRVASVPRETAASELSYTIETYEFQCAGSKWRTAGAKEYDHAGVETGDYPEADAAWENANPSTPPGFIKTIACDNARSPTSFPTLQAFIQTGRP